MNILHILDGFTAGIEKQAFEIINHLPNNGNKILFNILEVKDLESDFKIC